MNYWIVPVSSEQSTDCDDFLTSCALIDIEDLATFFREASFSGLLGFFGA